MATAPFLPEIGAGIADHLECRDLYSCIRVCRAWYQLFIANVWKVMHMTAAPQKYPTLAVIQLHAPLIRSLKLDNDISLEYLFTDCRHLEGFYLMLNSSRVLRSIESLGDELEQMLLRVVYNNSFLNTISLEGCGNTPTATFWKACLKRFNKLRYVKLRKLELDANSFSWCWATLARTQRISIVSTQWGLGSQLTPTGAARRWPDLASRPITQQIELCQLSDVSVQEQWQFMAQCSEAKEIRWRPCLNDFGKASAVILSGIINPGTWPRLQRLNLSRSGLSDRSFSTILDNLNPLSHLDALATCFGTLAVQPLLLQHILALQHLDLSECDGMTSPDIQRILTSGVQLELFKAHRLQVEELDSPDCKPWACTKIKVLTLSFDTQLQHPHRSHGLIFAQMARLGNMQALDISREHNQDLMFKTVRFRLDLGLHLLSCWKDLRELFFINAGQDLTIEDAEWMAKHWSLTQMYGSLHSDNQMHDVLYNIIMRRQSLPRKY